MKTVNLVVLVISILALGLSIFSIIDSPSETQFSKEIQDINNEILNLENYQSLNQGEGSQVSSENDVKYDVLENSIDSLYEELQQTKEDLALAINSQDPENPSGIVYSKGLSGYNIMYSEKVVQKDSTYRMIVECPFDWQLLGGGCSFEYASQSAKIVKSGPSINGLEDDTYSKIWECEGALDADSPSENYLHGFAICGKVLE